MLPDQPGSGELLGALMAGGHQRSWARWEDGKLGTGSRSRMGKLPHSASEGLPGTL